MKINQVFINLIILFTMGTLSLLSIPAQTPNPSLLNGFPITSGIILFNSKGTVLNFISLVGKPNDVELLSSQNELAVACADGEFLILEFNGTQVYRTFLGEINDVDVLPTPDDFLLCSRAGRRVFFFNQKTETQQNVPFTFSGPTDADLLPNGHLLVCDAPAGKVIEITREGQIVWSYDQNLKQPMDALRLDNGNTLISDFDNHRILEISPAGTIKSKHSGFNHPIKLNRIPNGDILVADADQQRLVSIASDGMQRVIRDRLNYIQVGLSLPQQPIYLCAVHSKFSPTTPTAIPSSVSRKAVPSFWKIYFYLYWPYWVLTVGFLLWMMSELLRFGRGFKKVCLISAYLLILGVAYRYQVAAASQYPYRPALPFWTGIILLTLFSCRDAVRSFLPREKWPGSGRSLRFPFAPSIWLVLLMWPIISVVCQFYHLRIGPLGFLFPWYVPMISWGIGIYFLFCPWFKGRDIWEAPRKSVSFGKTILAVPFTTGSVYEEEFDTAATRKPQDESPLSQYWANTSVILITILAACLYMIGNQSIPTDVHGDEGEVALQGIQIRDAGKWNWFDLGEFYLIPKLFFLIPGWGMWLFGDNLFGARMAGALIGVAAVPLVYLLARRLLQPTPAAMATFLFASCSYVVHFSRMGTGYNQTPLFLAAGLYFLLRGIQDGSGRAIAVSGFISGLGLLSYQATHLLPPLILSSLALMVLNRTLTFRSAVTTGLTYLLSLWVTASPLLGNHFADPVALFSRANSVSLLSVYGRKTIQQDYPPDTTMKAVIMGQLERSLLAPITHPDRSPYLINNQYGGMLDNLPAIFFASGIFLLLLALRNPSALLILYWTPVAVLAAAALTSTTPAYQRLNAAIIFLPLSAAPMLQGIILCVSRACRWPPYQRGILTCSVLGLLLIMGMHRYFHQIMSVPQLLDDSTRVARYLHDAGPTTYTYFFGQPYFYFEYGNIRFLAPEAKGEDVLKPEEFLNRKISRQGRITFVLIRQNNRWLTELRRLYPGGRQESHSNVQGAELFATYEVNL